jgi:indolepyruvate decarboxylase
MKDVLVKLMARIELKNIKAPKAQGLGKPVGKASDPITVDYLYARWEQMLKEDDVLVTETGTSSMGLGFAQMPKGIDLPQSDALGFDRMGDACRLRCGTSIS